MDVIDKAIYRFELVSDPCKIWDGIIAEITDNGLSIITKFEVKSGLQGFKQGFEQILATQPNRFTSFGDELFITLSDGTQRVFRKSDKPGPDTITGLKSENILITSKGEISFLPNQFVEEGDFRMENLILEIDGREIDHCDIEALALDLLMSYNK